MRFVFHNNPTYFSFFKLVFKHHVNNHDILKLNPPLHQKVSVAIFLTDVLGLFVECCFLSVHLL